jgi:hypothetical protein
MRVRRKSLHRLVRLFRLWAFGNRLRKNYARALRSARKTRDEYKGTEHHGFFSFRVACLNDAARMRCLPNAGDVARAENGLSPKDKNNL